MEFFIAYLHCLCLLPCGRRGTACGGGWRTRYLIRIPCILAPILALYCKSAESACECPTLQCPANQLGSPAITHRYRGTPSFRERGLFCVHHPSFSFHTLALLCTHGTPADLLVVKRHTIDTTLEHGSGAHYFERR